ncbi:MAG: flagellin [Geminicoccales bacterium]
MLNRIGDFAQADRMTSLLLQTQTRTRLTQAQISTGKVSNRFQDIAPNVERLIDVKVTLQANQQFQESNDYSNRKLTVMEAAVSDLVDTATRAQTLAIQRTNDGSAFPGMIGPEFEALLDQAVALLNTDMDDRYLFGGSRTDEQPIVLDPNFANFGLPDDTYYQGDELDITVRADLNIDISHSMSANREGFQELIGGIRGLINGDVLDDPAILESSLGLIHDSLGKIADYQAELGTRQAQLDRINQRHTDAEVYLENRISEIEDVDITEAITRLADDQVLLEGAMATIGRLNQLSLVDFL